MHTKEGSDVMKLLKIENDQGFFLGVGEEYHPIDQVKKEDLLRMVELILAEDVDMDEYDEQKVKHQAHQVVYKSIYRNFQLLKGRRQEFTDESERLYLADYEKYKEDASQRDF